MFLLPMLDPKDNNYEFVKKVDGPYLEQITYRLKESSWLQLKNNV